MACIHYRWARARIDGHSERLADLISRGSLLDGGFDVKSDAVVAAHSYGDAQRNQFFSLCVQCLRNDRRLCNVRKALYDLGSCAAQISKKGRSDRFVSRVQLLIALPRRVYLHCGASKGPILF